MQRRTFVAALTALVVAPLAAAQSQARRQLSRMSGDLGDSMESILSQMPDGMQPRRERRGEQRIFTYTFTDRSQLIFTFVPREGGGQGLVLYSIGVEE